MARRVLVELFLDSTQYEKGFARASNTAGKFNKDLSHMIRGTISGTGVMRGFARSLAFASGGFLAFESGSAFIRESINAAREAAVSQRSLAAQMRTSGQSFKANQQLIEETALSYGKFGFQNDEVIQSLTVLDRATGDVNKAISLQGLVADLARAKNMQLSAAAAVVGKVFSGQTTALRRAVPGLSANAKGWDLIRRAQARLAGQAAANTTVSERFAATLHDTEEQIGTALLPVLNTYLDRLSKWLDHMNRSGKLQKNLNTLMEDATPIVNDLAGAMGGLAQAVGLYNQAAAIANKVGFGFLFKNVIGGGIEQFKKTLTAVKFLTGAPLPKDLSGSGGGGDFGFSTRPGEGPFDAFVKGADEAARKAQKNMARLRAAFTADQNKWFDARLARQLDRVQDLALRNQLGRLKQIAEVIRDRINATKDVTRRLNLQDQLVRVLREEKSVQEQITGQMKEQTQALKDRAEAIKSALIDRLQAQQDKRDNAKAIKDAQDQLALARKIGGPRGIRNALNELQDLQSQARIARLQAKPATLRRLPGGGQAFALGNVITINVNGAQSPEKVASEVAAILKRRARHTTTQQRGPGR